MTQTSSTRRERIVILGGGAAGLAAAWRLSSPGWEQRYESITVYQRGGRLGGKGASSRGSNGRIEEHGLHVWLGYYENAFRLVREIYEELDRPTTDPAAPIQTWTDAFKPASVVGLEELHAGEWKHWVATFADNDRLPGEPDAGTDPMGVFEFIQRALRLLADFYASLEADPASAGKITISASPEPPRPHSPPVLDPTRLRKLTRNAAASALAAVTQAVGVLKSEQRVLARDLPLARVLDTYLSEMDSRLKEMVISDDDTRRLWFLADLIVTTVRGILEDGLLTDPRGFSAINDEEYRDWMRRHGASEETLQSPLVKGVYDLVFGYQDGDRSRPRFAAGLGLFLSAKLFFDYKGSIFWKMQAGMGDVLFAPMYQTLRARGVDFEFFHRVDALRLSDDHHFVESIEMGRQIGLKPGLESYEPLIQVKGLPCFPADLLADQLDVTGEPPARDLESIWTTWEDAGSLTLRRGRDFDTVLLAIPVGMIPYLCEDLIDDNPAWKGMVSHLGTVATQACQLWLNTPTSSLEWSRPGVTMTGYVEPFDTWSSMEHLIPLEDWPDNNRPKSLAYFCDTLATPNAPEPGDHSYTRRQSRRVRNSAIRFLDNDIGHFWPGAVDRGTGRFRWELLTDETEATGPARFDSQFWIANVDPSERYVQSLPGSDKYRLRPDGSGYRNLYLAGDWTDCGLNAGCVEAAVISGLQAANAIRGTALDEGVAGYYMEGRVQRGPNRVR